MIYYIDSTLGNDQNSGATPDTPKRDYLSLNAVSGDSILSRKEVFTVLL